MNALAQPPRKPRPDPITERVERVFEPDGLLVRAGREYRPGQHEFARKVTQCLVENRCGLLEASCGVGKSFGILAPAIIAAARGKRIVIAVATNALIEQLRADMPIVSKMIGVDVPFVCIKGRQNSICAHKLSITRKHFIGGHWLGRGRMIPEDERVLGGLLRWTKDERNVDLTLQESTLSQRVRHLVTIDADGCRKARRKGCAWAGRRDEDTNEEIEPCRCAFLNSRRGALDSEIVITNFDVLLWNYRSDGGMIGNFDAVILDEAHEFSPSKIRDAFTLESSPDAYYKLIELANDTPGLEIRPLTIRLGDACNELETALHEFARIPENHADLYFETLLDPIGAERIRLASIVQRMLGTCGEIYQAAVKARVPEERLDELDGQPSLKRLLEALAGTQNESNFAISLTVGPLNGQPTLKFTVVPVQLGGYMKQTIYFSSKREQALYEAGNDPVALAAAFKEHADLFDVPTIAVSATLTPDGTWAHPKHEFSMPKNVITCQVESPFDYAKNGLWYVPRAMPSSSGDGRAAYTEAAIAKAQSLVRVVGGRTLVLCSRRADMKVAADAIRGLGFNVFMQDEAPARELTRRFKEDPTSCLIGSRTFGTGFDVPGGALECVIVWSLPYPHPGPVDELLKRRMGSSKWMNLVYTPAMLLAYRQWIGRAIRTTKDIGVIAMLDATKYATLRKVLEGAMPKGIRLVREMADVDEFLKGHRAA